MKYLRPYNKWILLFLATLLPRLWQLDRFITPDEVLFLDHARQFLGGLASGDLLLTLGIGYPGVTLAWANALGLLVLFGLSRLGWLEALPPGLSLSQFLDAADFQPLPYYIAGRVVTALLVTVLMLVFYALVRRLLASEKPMSSDVALLGALLLALDPYVLGYSRLMHIAVPLALLMLLAAIAWMLWLREGGRRWLLLAGLFSGLAILTKTTALLLPPFFLGLALLAWLIKHPGLERLERTWWAWAGRVLVGWLVVLLVAVLAFYALWPAMWGDSRTALALTFGKLWIDREAGEGNLGMFWMGRFVEDPGPAFYPMALLLKLSPIMLVGLAFSLLSLRPRRGRSTEWGLWAYALLYLLAMTAASKKSVRYMLPAFAAFGPLAASGLLHLGRWIMDAMHARRQEGGDDPALENRVRASLRLGLGLLLLAFVLIYGPYYLSYYNPMLIGWRWAPQAILVGWGEGLGDAARYLNQQPGAEGATVAAWYNWTFAPFFRGQTLPFSSENALQADYSVLYLNQVQRNIPDPNLITYFQRRRPEHVVRLNGIDYAWVYPSVSTDGPPPASAIPVGVPMGETVALEGYEVRPARDGQGLIVTLYWRALRSDLPDYFVYMRAVDEAGQIYARSDSPPVMNFWPTSRWEAGKLVTDEQVLPRPSETEPGTYRLEVGMYDPQTWAVLEPASGQRGEGGGLLLGEVSLP